MLSMQLFQKLLEINLSATPSVEIIKAQLKIGTKFRQCRDPVKQIETECILRSFRQLGSFAERKLESACHVAILTELVCSCHRGGRPCPLLREGAGRPPTG
jgi:hypothetical protein